MARRTRFTLGAFGALALALAIGVILWVAPSRQTISAQDNKSAGPLIARGVTDAPAGTALITGDTALGGGVLTELRVVEGQHER